MSPLLQSGAFSIVITFGEDLDVCYLLSVFYVVLHVVHCILSVMNVIYYQVSLYFEYITFPYY